MEAFKVSLFHLFLFCLLKYSSNLDMLAMYPSGTNMLFVDSSTVYVCAHTHREDGENFHWLINGIEIESTKLRNVSDITLNTDISQLYITRLSQEFNQTTVQCEVTFTDGSNETSITSQIFLQGVLSPVGSLKTTTQESSILVSWTAPFSFVVNGNKNITYFVTVHNMTSSEPVQLHVAETHYNLTGEPPRRIACDDYRFVIVPVNTVGFGNSTDILRTFNAPVYKGHTLELNLEQEFNLILQLSALLCKVQNISLKTIYMNTMKSTDNYDEFSLVQLNNSDYNYIFYVSLTKNNKYELEMSLQNSNSTINVQFNTSTHDVDTVSVSVVSQTELSIQTKYFPRVIEAAGTFVTLLHCGTETLNSYGKNCVVDFEKSLYLPLNRKSSQNYTLNYTEGEYLVYAYDIEGDGTLFPSINDSLIFPAYDGHANLSPGRENISNSYDSNELMCELTYFNETVTSSCYNKIMTSSKYQVVLQPRNSKDIFKLTVSEPEKMCNSLEIEVETNSYYGVIFPIGDSGIVNSKLTARYIDTENNSSFHNNSDVSAACFTMNGEVTTNIMENSSESSYDKIILISVLLGALMTIIIIITITVIAIIVAYRRRQTMTIEPVNPHEDSTKNSGNTTISLSGISEKEHKTKDTAPLIEKNEA